MSIDGFYLEVYLVKNGYEMLLTAPGRSYVRGLQLKYMCDYYYGSRI